MLEYKVKTNWCVITGAPSSGKTSVIEELARRGYHTEPEEARSFIEACLRRGKKIENMRKHSDWLQREILYFERRRERQLDYKELIFLDRGIPDSLTYSRLAGLELSTVKSVAREFQYHAVFIFDRLSIVKDGVRTENDTLAQQIDLDLQRDYTDLGYSPVRVPVISIPERADFVLRELEKQSLSAL